MVVVVVVVVVVKTNFDAACGHCVWFYVLHTQNGLMGGFWAALNE